MQLLALVLELDAVLGPRGSSGFLEVPGSGGEIGQLVRECHWLPPRKSLFVFASHRRFSLNHICPPPSTSPPNQPSAGWPGQPGARRPAFCEVFDKTAELPVAGNVSRRLGCPGSWEPEQKGAFVRRPGAAPCSWLVVEPHRSDAIRSGEYANQQQPSDETADMGRIGNSAGIHVADRCDAVDNLEQEPQRDEHPGRNARRPEHDP